MTTRCVARIDLDLANSRTAFIFYTERLDFSASRMIASSSRTEHCGLFGDDRLGIVSVFRRIP
jgi:hypothetical protein